MSNTASIQKVKELIGDEAVQVMIDNFAGMLLYIPKKGIDFLDQEAKELYIRNLFFESGRSIEYIADKVDLSIDRVRKIINKR